LPKDFVYKLKEIYQILDKCERRGYNPSKTLSKVLPHVVEVVEKYKKELYKLPHHIYSTILEIYTSTMGKHGHYNDKRKEKNLNDLRKGIGELFSYLKK
jgi:nitric oxide synthase oxygenase domain/subunit